MAGDLDLVIRFWRAHDSLFGRVDQTRWGAVVSDPRYPKIQEPNYARVETGQPARLWEVEAELLPALERTRCRRAHVVVFRPEHQTDLIAEASTRGEQVTWDYLMLTRDPAPALEPQMSVEEVRDFGTEFWQAHRESARLFDISDEETLDQLAALEREVMIPAGKRWFVVRDDDGRAVAYAALLVFEGVAEVDHVVTFPHVRRRGHATALVRRLLAEADAAGAELTFLLAEPGGQAARLYERIGFRGAGHLASWITPLDR